MATGPQGQGAVGEGGPGDRPGLPEPVRRYLERALPAGGAVPREVRLGQEGEMRQKPGGRALRFDAVQRLAVDRVAFRWRARFPLAGPLALRVEDEYADGEGGLAVRLLGLPLARRRGPEVTEGEALRYLAELPWVPHALAHNRELLWRSLDERTVEVATGVGGRRLAVELAFDADGDVARASSSMRQLERDGRWTPAPWGGEFGGYERLGGIRLPTRGEVFWELEGGRFVYWRGRVTSVELV